MNTFSGSSASSLSSSGLAAANTLPATPVFGKGQKAAREFEAQLIGTVLQSLEKTFADLPGEDAMAGSDDYNYLGTQALASALAAGGGFGIAHLISQHLGNFKSTHEGMHEGLSPAPPEPAPEPLKFSVTSADGTT
jgi:Rod binding domain-containing protein